jgi:hypothetical protein
MSGRRSEVHSGSICHRQPTVVQCRTASRFVLDLRREPGHNLIHPDTGFRLQKTNGFSPAFSERLAPLPPTRPRRRGQVNFVDDERIRPAVAGASFRGILSPAATSIT